MTPAVPSAQSAPSAPDAPRNSSAFAPDTLSTPLPATTRLSLRPCARGFQFRNRPPVSPPALRIRRFSRATVLWWPPTRPARRSLPREDSPPALLPGNRWPRQSLRVPPKNSFGPHRDRNSSPRPLRDQRMELPLPADNQGRRERRRRFARDARTVPVWSTEPSC